MMLAVITFLFLSIQTAFSERLEQALSCPHPDQRCSHPPFEEEAQESPMVFMSFSVPLAAWKDLSSQLEKTAGRFVVRGIPNNSFELFAAKVWQFREAGVNAPIDIDPDLFVRYGVKEAPSIVVVDGKKFDCVAGNLRLDAALWMMADSGDVQERERALLERL